MSRRDRCPYPLSIARQSALSRARGLAAKPEIVALLRWRVLYTHRERGHVRSFRAQMVSGGRGLIPRASG